jgi:hypothetical protein
LVNGRYSVYNKANGVRMQTMTDASFWARAGVSLAKDWGVTEPRIIFDAQTQRWFALQIDDPECSCATGPVLTNRFLLAVSGNANPLGSWNAFAIPSDPTGNTFADFPTLGLDEQGVYLSAAMFDAGDNLMGFTLVSFPKAGLVASKPSVAGATSFGVMTNAGNFLQPNVCVDGSVSGAVLATDGLGWDYFFNQPVTNTALVDLTVQNADQPGAAVLVGPSRIAVPGFTAPLAPSQPDYTQNLDAGDARFSALVHGVGGLLYAAQAVQLGPHSGVRWYRIKAADYSVVETGTISDPELDLFYPSIAASTNGTIVIAFNGSSISNYVSSYAVAGNTVNGVTTFGSLVLLASGTASYQNIDSTGMSRWGDYSATSVDPADPTRFWTIQTIPTGPGTWSTQITELITGPPALTFTRHGRGLKLSWSLLAADFDLQASTNFAIPPSWATVDQGRATNGAVISVVVPAMDAQNFFRLSQHP